MSHNKIEWSTYPVILHESHINQDRTTPALWANAWHRRATFIINNIHRKQKQAKLMGKSTENEFQHFMSPLLFYLWIYLKQILNIYINTLWVAFAKFQFFCFVSHASTSSWMRRGMQKNEAIYQGKFTNI